MSASTDEKSLVSQEPVPKKPNLFLQYLGILVVAAFIFLAVRNALDPEGRLRDPSVVPPSLPALEARLDDYLNIPDLIAAPSGQKPMGKVVVVDTVSKTLHPFTRMLPRKHTARKPEEVSVVIWIESENHFAFNLVPVALPTLYEPAQPVEENYKLPAYRAEWHVTVIDFASKTVIAKRSFVGEDPPDTSVAIIKTDSFDQWQITHGPRSRLYEGGIILWSNEDGQDKAIGIVGRGPGKEVLAWLESLGMD